MSYNMEQLAGWLNPAGYLDLLPLMQTASALVEHELELCAIANIGFGSCAEDCVFCAQNCAAPAIDSFSMPLEEIIRLARLARQKGATRFSLVASGGYCPDGERFRHICNAISVLRQQVDIIPCASLGILRAGQADALYAAGLKRYHHNLESARSFYPQICSSHSWQERWQTNLLAREAGLEICCGGLLGLGESMRQRAEFALALGELQPDSIALNFYIPVAGSGLKPDINALQALAACAVFKLCSPESRLRLCGGREQHLGPLSALAHWCGLGGLMVGDYLTTRGVDGDRDEAELKALKRVVLRSHL